LPCRPRVSRRGMRSRRVHGSTCRPLTCGSPARRCPIRASRRERTRGAVRRMPPPSARCARAFRRLGDPRPRSLAFDRERSRHPAVELPAGAGPGSRDSPVACAERARDWNAPLRDISRRSLGEPAGHLPNHGLPSTLSMRWPPPLVSALHPPVPTRISRRRSAEQRVRGWRGSRCGGSDDIRPIRPHHFAASRLSRQRAPPRSTHSRRARHETPHRAARAASRASTRQHQNSIGCGERRR